SPYSVKVRSYFRYKELDHVWIIRSFEGRSEFNRYAKIPIVPLVVTPDDIPLQDSTPLMEKLEKSSSGPKIIPDDSTLAFLSRMIEEYADEWVNKPLFHYRWNYKKDEINASKIISTYMTPQILQGIPLLGQFIVKIISLFVAKRQISRRFWLGTFPVNAPIVESSFIRILDILDSHLETRPYILGKKPSMADFGLWGQIYNLHLDPTPHSIIIKRKNVLNWVKRMLSPKEEGDFETLEQLIPTLKPILEEVADIYFPWAKANFLAITEKKEKFDVQLKGQTFEQKPIKYQAKTFKILQDIYKEYNKNKDLNDILEKTGCLKYLNEE
ncbi:MAG: glutathione S-transferase C-terminal domain-containing protein, partial [Bdellovibrionota bacterium]|nr:glutathione S-transferase C-terminal domain-containing protein [Bdellovibrionota bacterium]